MRLVNFRGCLSARSAMRGSDISHGGTRDDVDELHHGEHTRI